ncbi:LmbU family transcriptional regulator [Streptomyces sp. P9-2B-2]|uniref:LmbU family transcriptional regulator n=1 Tax=Streptomyces sp. P9-2B-2 TaxID=3057114 RepID=UPI0025B5D2F0|nr:LmbU family transcriptional regulator [Streptomyces sp. P9-2B-2]WJY37073.1 LmbU family transcriptional regulator [Streptomyces sp. P9-2B-2]
MLTTRVGLQMPPDLSFEDWERAGRRLSGVLDSSSWWLGDWLVYGKDNYVDRYQRGIRAAGLKYQTLRNYAWVSRRFGLSRRRAGLSFQHHAEVASRPVDEQEWWLDRAEELSWTTKQLRNSIRDTGDGGPGDQTRPAVTRRLAVPGSRLEHWRKAAQHAGIEFEKWVWATLDNEAERALEHVEEGLGISA